MTAVMLMGIGQALAGWTTSYVDEETIVADEPHEERTSDVQTTFDVSDPEVLRAHTAVLQTCRTWTEQTIKIAPVQLKQKLVGGEVVATKRKELGNPRTVRRNTEARSEPCGETPATDLVIDVLGRPVTNLQAGTWTVVASEVRPDVLLRLARDSAQYGVQAAEGGTRQRFPPQVHGWAADARRRIAREHGILVAEEEAVEADQLEDALQDLPGRLEAYEGPWLVAHQVSPIDDRLEVVVRRDAADAKGSPPPQLIAQCAAGQLDLYVKTQTRIAREPGVPGIATVILRLDAKEPETAQAQRSGDGEALFLDGPASRMAAMAEHGSLLIRYTPHHAPPVDASFDLTGFDTVWPFLRLACAE